MYTRIAVLILFLFLFMNGNAQKKVWYTDKGSKKVKGFYSMLEVPAYLPKKKPNEFTLKDDSLGIKEMIGFPTYTVAGMVLPYAIKAGNSLLKRHLKKMRKSISMKATASIKVSLLLIL